MDREKRMCEGVVEEQNREEEEEEGAKSDLVVVSVGVLAEARRLPGGAAAVVLRGRAEGALDGGEPRRAALLAHGWRGRRGASTSWDTNSESLGRCGLGAWGGIIAGAGGRGPPWLLLSLRLLTRSAFTALLVAFMQAQHGNGRGRVRGGRRTLGTWRWRELS